MTKIVNCLARKQGARKKYETRALASSLHREPELKVVRSAHHPPEKSPAPPRNSAILDYTGEAFAKGVHDLRNALQAISNIVYLAKEKAKMTGDPALSGLLESIREQTHGMNTILTNMQDHSRPLNAEEVRRRLGKAHQ